MQTGLVIGIILVSIGALATLTWLTVAMDRCANYKRRRAQEMRRRRRQKLREFKADDGSAKALSSPRSKSGLPAPPRLPLPVLPQQEHKQWAGSKATPSPSRTAQLGARRNSFDRDFDDHFIITDEFDSWDDVERGPSSNWTGSRSADVNAR